VKDKFTQLCIKQLEEFYSKDAQKSKDYGRIVNRRHVERISKLIDAHKSDIITGGKVDIEDRYIAPTIIKATTDSKVMQEEIFGPVMPFVEYKDLSEAIKYINSRPKPLALYAFTNSSATAKRIIDQTSSGGVTINDCLMHFANPSLPFGGVGNSGMGSYHGKFGYELFSHSKPVLHKSIYMDAPARYPPYTDGKYKLFKYVSTITRVNSASFSKFFKFVLIPMVIAVVAHKLGVKITWQSKF